MEEWIGKSIKQLNFRVKYNANILGIKKEGESTLLPDADHIFSADEHLMVIGKKEDIDRIVKRL